jgi:hypothetical protein
MTDVPRKDLTDTASDSDPFAEPEAGEPDAAPPARVRSPR